MSIHYDKELCSNPKFTVKINISGFKGGIVSNTDLKLSLYAYDTASGKPIFRETLDYSCISELYNHLNGISIIRDNSRTYTNQFIELDEENKQIISLITTSNTELLQTILQKVESEKKQNLLLAALTDSELDDLGAAIKQGQYATSLRALTALLTLEASDSITEFVQTREDLAMYKAAQPEKIFQNWIERNIWTLGIDYIKQHSAKKIGINTISDLIMESTDGFIDLIELKRPKADIFTYDKSHKCYYPSKDLSLVIGQCMHYLKKLDEYKLNLEREYKFKVLRPRIKILIGRTCDFNDEQYEALRMLNSNLTHIQIISYDYILACGQTIMSYYK